MKKLLLLALLAGAALTACDSKNGKTDTAGQPAAVEQSQSATDAAAAAADTLPATALPAPLNGTMKHDVEVLLWASLDITKGMMGGNVPQEKQDSVQQLFDAAKQYYGERGQGQQLADAVKARMREELKKMAQTGQLPSTRPE